MQIIFKLRTPKNDAEADQLGINPGHHFWIHSSTRYGQFALCIQEVRRIVSLPTRYRGDLTFTFHKRPSPDRFEVLTKVYGSKEIPDNLKYEEMITEHSVDDQCINFPAMTEVAMVKLAREFANPMYVGVLHD